MTVAWMKWTPRRPRSCWLWQDWHCPCHMCKGWSVIFLPISSYVTHIWLLIWRHTPLLNIKRPFRLFKVITMCLQFNCSLIWRFDGAQPSSCSLMPSHIKRLLMNSFWSLDSRKAALRSITREPPLLWTVRLGKKESQIKLEKSSF